jgi:NADPH:quinone reductase-like Zn-dependent oxidoreductase
MAGQVEAVGKTVTRFQPGDEVFGGRSGTFAEYISIPKTEWC